MRTLLAVSVSVLSLLPAVSFADDIVATSKISAATVYSDRATITRTATIDIPAGSHTVSFEGLPPLLFPDSLRAEGEAREHVKFGAVASRRMMSTELSSERAEELMTQLNALQDQRRQVENEKAAIAAKKTFLTNLGVQAGLRANEEIAEINLKPEQWTGAAQALYTGLAETSAAEIQLDIKLRDIDKQTARIQGELNQQNTGQYSKYRVSVPLETASATQLTLNLSYQVPNASWRPIYDARLTTESAKLSLSQYGSVSQSTGEDWEGVKLTLSTAQPQRGASLPDLTPYWIDLQNYQTLHKAYEQSAFGGAARNEGAAVMSAPASAPMPMEMDASVSDQRLEEARFVQASIETGGFVSEYKIPGPASVTSDGTETKLMIGDFTTESILQVHIKPQQSTEAFVVAKTKLKGESPILPGQLNLFRDGSYVGQSVLPLLRPDEEHPLFFGQDDQVSVKRKVLKDEKSEAGMIVRDNTQERHFVTEIQNLHSKPVEIVVKETVPTSRNDKIRVEILKDATTDGYEADSANIKGLLRWQFTLDAKAKKDLKLGWTVSWPKDTNLSGL